MTPIECGYLAIQLKKAKKAKKPYYFWFIKEGPDGSPILIVERLEADANSKGRKAKATATKKLQVTGRVEAIGAGKVGFFGEGKIPAQQMRKEFKETLAKNPELSGVSEILKQAEIADLADAPSMAQEPDDVRAKAGRMTEDDEEEDQSAPTGPTKEDWVKASGNAKALYLSIKATYGEDSEAFRAIKEAQQAAFAAKKRSIAQGLSALDELTALAARIQGAPPPPAHDWDTVNSQLQLAKKSTRPFWFWYCRQGQDDLPILLVDRKEASLQTAAKEARRVAQKKKAISGWIERTDDGSLLFWCEGEELSFAQVERDFKQLLAPLDALSTSSALLRKATFRTVESGTKRPVDEDDELTMPPAPDTTTEQTLVDLTSRSTPPDKRYPVLLGQWNGAALAFSTSLRLQREAVENNRALSQLPQGIEAVRRLRGLSEFFDSYALPLDRALQVLDSSHKVTDEPPVAAAAKEFLAALIARGELKKLEETDSGDRALYSQPVEVLKTLVESLTEPG